MQVSWLHNCMIIRLIHTGSNYTDTTAATAHSCCWHVGSGSAMEPGKVMDVGSMGIPSSNASSGPAEILHCKYSKYFGIHQSAGMACGPFEDRDFPLHLGVFCISRDILATYTNTVFVYIPNISKDWLLNWPPHILPEQSFIQKQSPGLLFCMTKIYSSTEQRPWRFPKKIRTTSLKLGEIQGAWAL